MLKLMSKKIFTLKKFVYLDLYVYDLIYLQMENIDKFLFKESPSGSTTLTQLCCRVVAKNISRYHLEALSGKP